jgi:hypothetical protein
MTIEHWAWFNPLLILKGFGMDKKQLMGFLIVFLHYPLMSSKTFQGKPYCNIFINSEHLRG